nr:retrotransposon protein, putative, Ty1-copia subclass [Tanacetum cinerariifolium]
MEWYRNLRIVLFTEDKLPFVEHPIPTLLVPPEGQKNQKKKSHKAAKGNQGKGKAKMRNSLVHAPSYAHKPENPPTPKKDNPAKDAICHQFGEIVIKAKLNLDFAFLWHCRLGHINKKRIEKLQHDGLLDSTDIKSFEKCVSCMSGKMARKPYSHQVKRAKYLLGLIHTNVCGPFKIMPRQGAYYFVTFTDDFSRYGYVYLLKHKHEVFETFKVFLKEVENQLGKAIKSLRSDREGEYTSQEFLDHLKDHGIIAHRTPPYTPQHNGVSERRNRTLLDMSIRIRRAPDRMCLYIDVKEHELGDLGELANYKAALLGHESDKWLNAMNVEMQSMKENEVWELVELPPNAKTIGHKWLFKKKTDMDGVVHTYKAHLVAKGFTQTSGIDYEETFSPVADIRAIRILIAIVVFYDYEIWQMDVKTAFLNGYLNEERIQNIPYALAVGSIMYVVRCTRLDVAFAQNITIRFQQNPGDAYWTAVKNILKYICNTKDMFLVYRGDMKRELMVSCYIDARYLTDADDMKS